MSRALMASTQIAVSLSLTVVTTDGRRTQVFAWPLVNLTPILFWLWSLQQEVKHLVIRAATAAACVVFTVEVSSYRLLAWLMQPVNLPIGVG
jgi:hypothetical protein